MNSDLKGEGAYSGKLRDVIFTITTLTELPKLKNVIFNIDPEAFVVVNSTLEVLGKRHGTRKLYLRPTLICTCTSGHLLSAGCIS
ncbi:MAG: YitT family protein [Pseudomonadota bacterium]|uniref:YitT family protein n=1 Tax=Candidatus Desulfatibia profunda TaxID=2841695 RepID=A0A8J6NR26_9BACT|nr:YitT family protein [Candidatus Desulfatibia profunda]MBL7179428.1 YitT family protein [Desulfobacterales bacterium]